MLPIDRTAKSVLDTNLVNGVISDGPLIKNSNDVVYNTIDELNSKVDSTQAAGAVTTTRLADGAVTAVKVAPGTLTLNEMSTTSLDSRYNTKTELQSVTSGSSGAKKIGATPIATSPSDVQGILEWLKNQLDSTVLGTIPDGSVTPVKLSFTAATQAGLDTHAKDGSHIPFGSTTGTANTYAVTVTPAPTSYTDGMAVSVKINVDASAASTLSVNTLGAKPLKKANGTDVINMKANGVYTFRYNSTTGNFILQGEGGGGTAVAGDILSGKTATTDIGDITGAMLNRGAMTISPGTTSQIIPQGYHNGSGQVSGDANLLAANIKNGVPIFGITGSLLSKNSASGTGTSTAVQINYNVDATTIPYYSFAVSGLTFTPTTIIIYRQSVSCSVIYRAGFAFNASYADSSIRANGASSVANVRLSGNASVTSTGFQLPVNDNNTGYNWIAYE